MEEEHMNLAEREIVLGECLGVSWPEQLISRPVRFPTGAATSTAGFRSVIPTPRWRCSSPTSTIGPMT